MDKENVYHNNLCCLLAPHVVCEECDFKCCRRCDDVKAWQLTTHNPKCEANDVRWDPELSQVIISKSDSDDLLAKYLRKTPKS